MSTKWGYVEGEWLPPSLTIFVLPVKVHTSVIKYNYKVSCEIIPLGNFLQKTNKQTNKQTKTKKKQSTSIW